MFKKFRKGNILILGLSVFLTTLASTKTISANENDFSINSEETVTYLSSVKSNKRHQLFNDNWKFIYGDQSNAEQLAYDDSSWREIQLPHDYSLELPYSKQGEAESGYKLGGIGWYRKSFTVDSSAKDKRVSIDFGGVYMNATVYINGHKLGTHPNGYTPFSYDITEFLNPNSENIIAVKVDHQFPSSRWYSGSGIYRDVHLTVTDKVHVEKYGVQVLSPNLKEQVEGNVDVIVNNKLINESSEDKTFKVKQSIKVKGTDEILKSVESDDITLSSQEKKEVSLNLSINKPTLWSLENPALYEVITEVLSEENVLDTVVTDYGFRILHFDANTGFHLNNKAVKLKGVSMHSDQGSLGAASHYRAVERQVEILQDMGVNAIRVTHNPADGNLIEIANRKGMLIIDEAFDTWVGSKNGNYNDYAKWFKAKVGNNPLIGATPEMTWAELDIKTMVERGKNAPSVISWSIGNEVMEGNSGPYSDYPNIAKQLAEWVIEVDKTRPATIGDNKLKGDWGEAIKFGENLTNLGGTVGFNYANGAQFDKYHANYPEWKMYGAETASSINSRGVYKPSNYDRHLTSYDESRVGWGHLAADSWYSIITRDFMAGEFVWTGFDYLGEPTPYNNVGPGATGAWPSPKSSYFGIVDTAGLPKDRFYFYQSQWNDDVNTLHVLPAWKKDMVTINNGKVRVDVYSDAAAVELFYKDTDGKETSLGKKEFTQYVTDAGHKYQVYEGEDKKGEKFRNLYLTWDVAYADGTVYAKGYDAEGNIIENTVGRNSVSTFDEAVSTKLTADRKSITADGKDLSYITIDVVDKDGLTVEDALNKFNVEVSGDGVLMALDNGDQVDHEPYDSGTRKAFNGKLVAIVKSTKEVGTINVSVSSEGLKTQEITITTTAAEENVEKQVIGYKLPKNYYVKLGYQPDLASKATLLFNDGTQEKVNINWNVSEDSFETTGIQVVNGITEEYDILVSTNVSVIESVGAILNYSTTTPTGVERVNLPSSRPIVLENGEVLPVEFPVEWDEQNSEDYKKEGTVIIKGIAKIFGEEFTVTSSIRVAKASISVGANVAPNYLTLSQSIPEGLQSDSLEAIADGDTNFKTVNSGPNTSVWTNYDMAQTGENKAELVFTFATAQFLGEVDLHFYQDAWAARLPENVELYWSNEGTENATWSKLDYEEIKGNEPSARPSVTKNTYKFNGVSAVGFKIVLTSNPGLNHGDKKLAVGLTEAELKVITSSLVVNKDVKLDELILNGVAANKANLATGIINTAYQKVNVEPVSSKNIATTILKEHEGVVRVINESEDHSRRETIVIKLDQEESESALPADNDSRDYIYDKTTATAGNFHPNHASEGHPKYAVDNKDGTIFHTAWAGTDMKNFWITLELEDVSLLESLRYKSRSGQINGIVKDYVVETSLDNETWNEVSKGQWGSKMNTWSIAQFEQPIEAKYVRLTALSTYGDGTQANKFMSAKEIRVRLAEDKEDITLAKVNLDETSYIFDGSEKRPTPTVTLDGEVLENGIDYKVEYLNNTEVGEGQVIIKGIVKYSGKLTTSFTIEKTPLNISILENKLELAELMNKNDYTEDSFKVLEVAITNAKKALNNPVSQEIINEAVISLQEAISQLIEITDTTLLEAMITKALDIDSNVYTETSFKALEESLLKAQKVLKDNINQEEIDEALKGLLEVYNNLELKDSEVDTKELERIIADVLEINATDYKDESYKALLSVLQDAQKVLEESKDQKEVYEIIENLKEAVQNLEYVEGVLDTRKLESLINETKLIREKGYTEESYKNLLEGIIKAEEALLNSTTQEEIDEAVINLSIVFDELKLIDVSISETSIAKLNSLISQAKKIDKELYTEVSIFNLEHAIENAEFVLSHVKVSNARIVVTQEMMKLVSDNLEKAINNLEKLPETSIGITQESQDKLKDLIAKAKGLDLGKFEKDGVNRLKEALEKATIMINKLDENLIEGITQDDVDGIISELNIALDGLKVSEEKPTDPEKPVEPVKPTEPEKPVNPVNPGNSNSEKPVTGITSGLGSTILVLTFASAILVYLNSKKNRKYSK